MSVRVRFAPSPTGYLHVGGLRTALYNYLFAKHHNGKCILRIEDTDRTRLVENATENLIKSLRWAGVEFDEGPENCGEYGPYTQSDRLSIYSEHIMKLLANGTAYYAFDTTEELEKMRNKLQNAGSEMKYARDSMRNQITLSDYETQRLIQSGAAYVVRMKVPKDDEIVFNDIIRGRVTVLGKDIDDQILLKSDGFPTYHLANVVDDYLMGITHVIRGEEWLPSTPKHVLLYDFFGWRRPEFAHLPLLLNKDKSKLSKRQGSVAVEDFIAKGYHRDAFINFIALLGWNPTADREIYSIDELIKLFNLEKVNKGGAVFDIQKLDWFNSQYIRTLPPEILSDDLNKILEKAGYFGYSNDYISKVIFLIRERIVNLLEVPTYAEYLFEKPKHYDLNYLAKHWNENTLQVIEPLVDEFSNCTDWTSINLHDLAKNYVAANGIKMKDILHPLRLMITGKSEGASMFDTLELIGKDECLDRMRFFMQEMKLGKIY